MIAEEMEKSMAFDCKYAEGVEREHTEGCIKHLSPDYIFKVRATMASVTQREKRSSMYTGNIATFSDITRF
jgi:hypothetical protein